MQRIIVDITPGFRMPTIHFSQGDVGTQFAVDLRSRFGDSLPASPTVTIQATKPSGFGFTESATSFTNGVAVFTTTADMTDEAGRFPVEIKVVKDSVTLFSANFYMEGEATTHPDGTIDGQQETVIPELTQLVERVETAASSVLDMTVEAETLAAGSQATYSYDEDTNTATFGIPQGEAGAGAAGVTASAYSASNTYAVGDYVIHNSNLYRCTTAITTAEAFTAAHWTQVVLGDDVSDLKSDINEVADVVLGEYTTVEMTTVNSMLINSLGQMGATSGYTSYIFPLEVGKRYAVTARNNEVLRVAFANSNSQEPRQLIGVHTSTNLSKYEFVAEYNYCWVFGITPSYTSATFAAQVRDSSEGLDEKVTVLESDTGTMSNTLDDLNDYVLGENVPVTLTEMEHRVINNLGQMGETADNYNSFIFPTKIGKKYTISAQNNEVLRVAFGNSNSAEPRQLFDVHTSSDLSKYEFVAEYLYCYLFGVTPSYPDATFTAQVRDNSESLIGQVENADYSSRGDCKTNGKLTKNGIYVVNSDNVPVELRGVGLHALLQYKNLHDWKPFYELKKMGVNLIRCSTYLQDNSFSASDNEIAYGYISHPNETKAEIERIVKNCIDLGLYVLIDWHHWAEKDGTVATYQSYAEDFFDYYSSKYADCPNVLYEICNEPYADTVGSLVPFIKAIRAIIKNNVTNPVMVTGCITEEQYPTWAQRCTALYSALSDEGITDVFISPHNYGGGVYPDVVTLINNGIPIFVTEWGNSTDSGDGQGDDVSALAQINSFHTNCVPQSLWKFTDQTMTSSLLANRGIIDSAKYSFGFTPTDLSRNGVLLLGKYKAFDTTEWIDRQPIN